MEAEVVPFVMNIVKSAIKNFVENWKQSHNYKGPDTPKSRSKTPGTPKAPPGRHLSTTPTQASQDPIVQPQPQPEMDFGQFAMNIYGDASFDFGLLDPNTVAGSDYDPDGNFDCYPELYQSH